MSLKHELQDIIAGNGSVRNGKIIQAITRYLKRKKKAIPETEKTKFNKVKEEKILIEFIKSKDSGIQK